MDPRRESGLMVFGSVLRLLRVDAGASLRSLAAAVGVSSAYLSRVENGHDPAPTPDRLIAIAAALGLPPSLLIELAERVEPGVSGYLSEVPAANRLFLEIARRRLTAAQISRLREFVDAEFPDPARADPPGPAIHPLLAPGRVIIGLRCATIEDLLDLAASRIAPACTATPAAIAAALRAREQAAPTALGGGLIVPRAWLPGQPPLAARITLATPLDPGPDGLPVRVALILTGPGDRCLPLLARAALLARCGLVAVADAAAPAAAIAALRAVEEWMGPERG